MGMADELRKLLDSEAEITLSDFEVLKELVKTKCIGYEIKQKRQRILENHDVDCLGERSDAPWNPTNSYFYVDKTKDALLEMMDQAGWCGQFAGRGQWARLGRVPKQGCTGLKTGKAYGRDIILFPYEQTEEAI